MRARGRDGPAGHAPCPVGRGPAACAVRPVLCDRSRAAAGHDAEDPGGGSRTAAVFTIQWVVLGYSGIFR